jgi:hypothetical protein
MQADQKLLSEQECETEVRLMARRTALLYSAFAATLVDALGEDAGKRLIAEAIRVYGETCGSAIRQEIEALGLPLSAENFSLPRDLPRYGFEHGSVQSPEGETHATVTYCPLAATFKSQGEKAARLGRLYCNVDQAKQQAYNPEFACVHVKNVLDGDEYCEFALRAQAQESGK